MVPSLQLVKIQEHKGNAFQSNAVRKLKYLPLLKLGELTQERGRKTTT